jgi:hypothetical protein
LPFSVQESYDPELSAVGHCRERSAYKGDLGTILVLDHGGTRVSSWAVDDELTHFVDVGSGDWLGVGELPGKDWRDTNLVGLNVDIG